MADKAEIRKPKLNNKDFENLSGIEWTDGFKKKSNKKANAKDKMIDANEAALLHKNIIITYARNKYLVFMKNDD